MLLGQSDVCEAQCLMLYMCVCQRLADDGQAGLTAEIQVFWDVAV